MISDSEYVTWLKNPSARRVVLVEVGVNIEGSETTLFLSTVGYATGPTETPPSTRYNPVLSTGMKFTEQLSLSGNGGLSIGDIEVSNADGSRDGWLDYVWDNRPIVAYIGGEGWARSDFRVIFNGIVATVGSRARDTVNLTLRDKMQRLNGALSEAKLSTSTTNKDAPIPLVFGEVHNVSPLLVDSATLEYQVHNAVIEDIIEVRDNGLPVTVIETPATGKFKLSKPSAGAITASVQGYKQASRGYTNTVAGCVRNMVTDYGKAIDRFTDADIDLANFTAFDSAVPYPVGIYISNRTNVITACQQVANSVGAQLVMSRLGKLRIIQLAVPGTGAAVQVGPGQMVERSLKVSSMPNVGAAINLGFCKNWTVQEGLLTALPEEHKTLFGIEWLTSVAKNQTVLDKYKLDANPEREDTMLLARTSADAEAARRLALWSTQRKVFSFEGTAELLATLELGNAITLTNKRFGLSLGKTGTVVSLSPDWMTGRVTVGVLI